MTDKIVIAELTKGTINPSTAELVAAAQAMGGNVTVVVPCTDASMADEVASYDGVSKVIAVKSDVFAGNDSSGWASARARMTRTTTCGRTGRSAYWTLLRAYGMLICSRCHATWYSRAARLPPSCRPCGALSSASCTARLQRWRRTSLRCTAGAHSSWCMTRALRRTVSHQTHHRHRQQQPRRRPPRRPRRRPPPPPQSP